MGQNGHEELALAPAAARPSHEGQPTGLALDQRVARRWAGKDMLAEDLMALTGITWGPGDCLGGLYPENCRPGHRH